MNQELQGSDDSAIRRFSIFTLSGQACCTMSSQTSNSWHWKGWDSYSLIVLPSLESKPILLTLDLWEGGGQQGGAFTDDKETLTKHGRRTLMPCHRVLSGTRALTAPAVLCLWVHSEHRGPRGLRRFCFHASHVLAKTHYVMLSLKNILFIFLNSGWNTKVRAWARNFKSQTQKE